jgi:mono/diheme cytochrome c family protein
MSVASLVLPPNRLIALLLQASAVVALSTQLAAAQDAGDTVAGRKLAHTWCDSCHVVDPAQQRGASNGAPSFAAVANMTSTTFLGLEAFLQTPHDRMPDLHLSRDEIDDVAAYIISLKKKS